MNEGGTTFGKRLRQFRPRTGLSQAGLAERARGGEPSRGPLSRL